MDNKKILNIAMRQSCINYGYDFNYYSIKNFVVLEPKEICEEACNYLTHKPYLNFLYYGDTVIALADLEIRDFVIKYLEKNKEDVYRIFDSPQITFLNNELERHNYCIAHMAQYFLPDVDYKVEKNDNIKTRLFIDEEIQELYKSDLFHNALSYSTSNHRKDVIAIAGLIDDKVVGVAGASNDSSTMWQIGIDVLKEYREQGIASTLVYLLSQEILKKGIVPFYCCAWSNIASKKVARKAGFKDSWIEMTAKRVDEVWIKNIRR